MACWNKKILDSAQELILQLGYSGMSVDKLLEAAGITKGAFFYHFRTKDDLAQALLRRFAEEDTALYEKTQSKAARLSHDPLQQMLLFIGLFEEMFRPLASPYPGCLFASYIYELQQFDEGTRQLIRESFRKWRELLEGRFRAIAETHPPKFAIDAASLADAFTVVLEGAFITAKALDEPGVIAAQLAHYRSYVELLFADS